MQKKFCVFEERAKNMDGNFGFLMEKHRKNNMFFWKIDDETIRCLINKEEIGQMGFDLKELGEDNEQMEEFLNAVIAD